VIPAVHPAVKRQIGAPYPAPAGSQGTAPIARNNGVVSFFLDPDFVKHSTDLLPGVTLPAYVLGPQDHAMARDAESRSRTSLRNAGGGGGGGGGGDRPCFDFQKGKCDRGDGCRFSHAAQVHINYIRIPPCVWIP